MTPAEFRAARKALGLSANGMAEALRLGKGGGRTVRRWESGETPVTGPVSVAVELLLRTRRKTSPPEASATKPDARSGL